MHLLAHWHFPTATQNEKVINDALAAALKPYSWVRPLPNCYVIKVQSSAEYTTVWNALTAVCNRWSAEVYLIVTPPMTGGRYVGHLPGTLWPELNSRSE